MSNGSAGKEVNAGRNWVAGAWEPMSDKRNWLGWCRGAKVKNFVKDVMETQSCEYGFILKWINCIYDAYKGVINFKNCLWKS